MWFFLSLICVPLVFAIIHVMLQRKRLNKYVSHLPKIPWQISLELLWQSNKTPIEVFQFHERVLGTHDGLSVLWIGPQLVIACDDPVNAKTILMSKHCLEKPYNYRFMAIGGKGLVTAKVHDWQKDRKNINTVFVPSALNSFVPIFNQHSLAFANSLEKLVDQPDIDLTNDVFVFNLELIFKTNFRCEVPTDSTKMVNCLSRLWHFAGIRTKSYYMHPSFIYRLTEFYTEEKKIIDFLRNFLPEVYQKGLSAPNNNDFSDHTKPVLIDKLAELESKGLLNRERIYDHMNTFIGAAMDTSSMTILNTLLFLAMHPNVQDRLYDEIRSNVSDGDQIDRDIINRLEYMDRVLKESLRLIPVAQLYARESHADVKLTNCTMPKGTVVLLSVLKMHGDTNIWGPNALQFDPDHFLPEAVAQRHPFAYLPFAAGPRNCIGYRYAMTSMKIILSHLLLKYKFTTSMTMSDVVLRFELLLKMEKSFASLNDSERSLARGGDSNKI